MGVQKPKVSRKMVRQINKQGVSEMKYVTIRTKQNPTEKTTWEFDSSTISKIKKDAVKTNFDGSLIMPNGDLIIIHNDKESK